MKMGRKKEKLTVSNIGRRTGINVLEGKLIRRRDDGVDRFEDYFTDSGSNQTEINDTTKNGSEQVLANSTIQDFSTVTPLKPLKSSLKKNVNERSEEYDYGNDCNQRGSKKKSLTFSEDLENTSSAKTKMTQTSNLVDETESSPSKNRTNFKEIIINNDDISDSETNSSVRGDQRVLSDISAKNRRENLSLSTNDTNGKSVSFSHKIKQSKNKSNSRMDEANDSPSRNRTHTQILYEKETGRKKADSSNNESNSQRKSPRILPSPSGLPNSREKDSKRHSYGERSQYTTKPSEVLNHKSNICSQNDRSQNRSELLDSPRRQSERKENRQKSSVAKLLITAKRKMQNPNALDSTVSKSTHIQNRGEEDNKSNSSGGKSVQQATITSAVLDLEKSTPSRTGKSVNRSETSVSGQKRNNHNSSIEKSVRASEHNMMEVSEKTNSHVKAIKPVHSVRRKIVFSGTSKVSPKSLHNLRRSSRKRFPRLASWRNQRLKFVRKSTGEFECEGVDEGQPEDDYPYRFLKRKLCENNDNLKISNTKKQKKRIKKTGIIDCESGKKVELYLHRPFSTYEWVDPMNEDAGYMISKVFSSQLISFGFLDIAAHSMKDEQLSPYDNIHFVVVKGVVDVVIATSSLTFRKNDSFIVPVCTGYSISNNTSSNALLSFTSFRVPIFKYQNVTNQG